ncbi:DUF86 domain-containing protein [Priestia taiwanensis]|nr:DUF86 domain-containing protein [Priestia taiwanensis]
MYFVDREKIEATLQTLEKMVVTFTTYEWNREPLYNLALERIVHISIESILDVGNMMIDGFIMRDPGSYEDIIDILEDEKVITCKGAEALKHVIGLRKMLVQEYVAISHELVEEVYKREYETLDAFPADIRRYLEKELGPVSAFKP